MKVHTIHLQARSKGRPGTYDSPQVYRCRSKHQGGLMTRFAIVYISAEGEYRTQKDGAPQPGPYAYPIALASALAEVGGTGGESARMTAQGREFEAEVGDYFVIDGELFELREDRPVADPRLAHIPTAARVLGDLTADDTGKHFPCEAALVVDNQPIMWAGVLSGVEHRPEANRLDPAGATIVEVEHPGNNMTFYQHASTPIRVEA